MAGNQAIFDRAMEQSQEAARREDWARSLKEGVRALGEFPSNEQARGAVATALFHSGKLPQALQQFADLHAANQDNPIYKEYLARIYRQQGELERAIDLYLELAQSQIDQKLPLKGVRAYRDILEIDDRHEEARIRLAMTLGQMGDKAGAVREFLTLGERYLEAGEIAAASEAVAEALTIDASSLSAQNFRRRIEETEQARLEAEMGDQVDLEGPLRTKTQIEEAGRRAIEYQNAGQLEDAATMYQKVVTALPERADIYYSLGLIYDELGRYPEAIKALEKATGNDEYALSAHYALGSVYQKQGKLERAAQEFEQSIRYVDLQSIGREEAADLIDMYEATAAIYQELGDIARAASLYSTLAGFLQGKRWGMEQATEYNTKAKELTDRSMMSKLRMLGTGILTAPPPSPEPETPPQPDTQTETWGKMPSITDFLNPKRVEKLTEVPEPEGWAEPLLTDTDPLDVLAASLPEPLPTQYAPLTPIAYADRSEVVQRLVEASERYAEQDLLYAAIDACHEVIKRDIEFYAIHLRMGEILERMGRPDEAVAKFNLLINTYKARGEITKAIDVYSRLIDLSTDSTAIRTELAGVLRSQGRNEDAAEHLAFVANQHFRMGQTFKSLEEFRRLLEWSPTSPGLRAQYGQVLLKLERWEAALDEFRRVLAQRPDDVVLIAQMNIALAMLGEYPDAIWDSLATLLEKLPTQGNMLNDVQAEYRSMLLMSDRPLLHYILGIIQQTAAQHPAALMAFEQTLESLESDPDPLLPTVLVHQALFHSLLVEGEVEQAIEQLRRIEALLATTPPRVASSRHAFAQPFSEGELQRHLAEAYAENNNFDGAIAALHRVKHLLPSDRAAYTKLADIYFRQGRLAEATAQLDELTTMYESQGQLDRALEMLESALKLAPNSIALKSRFTQMQLRRGYLDQGLAGLDELAELQRKQGQIKDAVASIQQAADVYWTLGQVDKASELYNRIVQIAPTDTEARQHLVSFNILLFRTQAAVEQLREIARLSLQQRRFEEAIASFHQIIALDQKDASAYEQLADTLMRINEYGQAVRVYKQLAKLLPDDERVEALQSAAQRMLDQQQMTSA